MNDQILILLAEFRQAWSGSRNRSRRRSRHGATRAICHVFWRHSLLNFPPSIMAINLTPFPLSVLLPLLL